MRKRYDSMDLSVYFKSVLEQDTAQIVICNTDHQIIYMNPTAVRRHEKRGGAALIGHSIFDCHNPHSVEAIKKVYAWFEEDVSHNIMFTYHNPKENKDIYMVALRDDTGKLIGYYEKQLYRDAETAAPYAF